MIKVGETLQKERRRQGYTLDQVAKATKIRTQFLNAIEEGTYEKLPGSNYAHGFVKNYIEFLGLAEKELLAIFRREYNEKELVGVVPESLLKGKELSLNRFSLHRTLWFVGVIILALGLYLFYQYRAAFFNPQLVIISPQEKSLISSQIITISGITDGNTVITVDNLPAFVDSYGKFTKSIPAFAGNVTITVKAVNSFGKITSVERHVIVKVGQ